MNAPRTPSFHRDTMLATVDPADTTHANVFTRDVETVAQFPPGTFDKP